MRKINNQADKLAENLLYDIIDEYASGKTRSTPLLGQARYWAKPVIESEHDLEPSRARITDARAQMPQRPWDALFFALPAESNADFLCDLSEQKHNAELMLRLAEVCNRNSINSPNRFQPAAQLQKAAQQRSNDSYKSVFQSRAYCLVGCASRHSPLLGPPLTSWLCH